MSTTTFQLGGRGCGERDEGVPYLCSGLSDHGLPAEAFLIDPVRAYTTGDADLPVERGMRLIKRKNQEHYDVLNTVSKTDYTPWAFFVEGKNCGWSRKIVNGLDISALTPGKSSMYFLHRFAIPMFSYSIHEDAPLLGCHVADLYTSEQWQEIMPGWHPMTDPDGNGMPCTFALKDLSILLENKNPRILVGRSGENMEKFCITLPGSWEYSGYMPDTDIDSTPSDWTAGIFLHVPITGIEWKGWAKPADLEKARTAGFDTAVLDW